MRKYRPTTVAGAAAAAALSAGLLLGVPLPAAAHDGLVSTQPAVESTISASPEEVSLTFSGELNTDPGSSVIEVIGPDGQNAAIDTPVASGVTIVQPLAPAPAGGTFTVRWKVVSSDGHPISGEFTYTVTAADAIQAPSAESAQTPTPSPSPTPSPTESTGSGSHGEPTGGGAALPVMAVVSGVLIVGGALFVVLMLGRERRRRDASDRAREGANSDEP